MSQSAFTLGLRLGRIHDLFQAGDEFAVDRLVTLSIMPVEENPDIRRPLKKLGVMNREISPIRQMNAERSERTPIVKLNDFLSSHASKFTQSQMQSQPLK